MGTERSIRTEKKRSRDVQAELLRTLACFMVILVHIRIQPVRAGVVLTTTVLVGCLLSSAVGLFFLVTGFFMYGEQRTWGKTARNFLLRILLPTLLTVFFSLIFNDWILGQCSAAECIKTADYPAVLNAMANGVLLFSSDYWGLLCAHLWYIAEYAKIILFFPAMAVLVKYAKEKILWYLAGLNLLYCCVIDLNRYFGQFRFLYAEPFLRVSQALVLFGFLIYLNKGKLRSSKMISAGLLAAYAASILWMFMLQSGQFAEEGGDWSGASYSVWLSGIGMLAAVLLAAFVLSLPENMKFFKWIEKPVLFFGSLSFPIYLIQYAVVMKLASLGVMDLFAAKTVSSGATICYYLIYGLLVFFLSAALVWCLRTVFALLQGLTCGLRQKLTK